MTIPQAFPVYRFEGTHYEIGRQFGEACADRIHLHLELAQERLARKQGINPATARRNALRFRPFVRESAPFFDEEIRGLAAGACISLEEAWLLQLRAELGVVPAEKLRDEPGDECTSYAALPEATSDGLALIGQNADLPPFYARLGVVVEFVFDDMPSVLMLTPAGQVSYLGINDRGMGAFANYLTCDGWRLGFPRYLLSRLALTCETVDDAIAAVRGVHRASSRNLLLMDAHTARDVETTPTSDAVIEPVGGLIAHANHYSHPALAGEERAKPTYLPNTRTREATMRRLLEEHRGALNPATMQDILRDRSAFPDCLCRAETDNPEHDAMTFASLIAQPAAGRMWIAVGPPHEYDYVEYAFSGVMQPA
jgi:isopenicillin-N N-acyltransferase-like protein